MKLTDSHGQVFMVHFFHTVAEEATDHKGLRKKLKRLKEIAAMIDPEHIKPTSAALIIEALDRRLTQMKTFCTFHPGPCAHREKNEPCQTPGAVVAETTQSLVDAKSPATGRKVALSRAIAKLPRQTRAQLWDCYLQKCPPKGRPKIFYGRETWAIRVLAQTHERDGGELGEHARKVLSHYRYH